MESEALRKHKVSNTKLKTNQDLNLFTEYLTTTRTEHRKVHDISPNELNEYLADFFSVIKRKDGKEYEATSLRAIFSSLERYLRESLYEKSLVHSPEFSATRGALKTKQKQVQYLTGKGKRFNKHDPLSTEEIRYLCHKQLLGPFTPESLINSLWLNNLYYFGLRGCREHRELYWGDIKLKRNTETGVEYLMYNAMYSNDALKISTLGLEKGDKLIDLVEMYKLYASKRPDMMQCDESPFYLAAENTQPGGKGGWYKASPMGINRLNLLLKSMLTKAGLNKDFGGKKKMKLTHANNNNNSSSTTNQVVECKNNNLEKIDDSHWLENEQQDMTSFSDGTSPNNVTSYDDMLLSPTSSLVSEEFGDVKVETASPRHTADVTVAPGDSSGEKEVTISVKCPANSKILIQIL